MATFHERLAIIVEANAGKAIAEFKRVGTAAKEAGVGADAGAKGLGRFGIAGQTATNLLKGGVAIAAAAAATAIAKFAVDGVTAFVEVTSEIRKFQRVSGATAEDASKLVAAFNVLGVDADAAGTAVFKMAVKIGSADKAFADTGVAVARTKNGTVDLVATILNLGDAFKAIPDASKRADLLGATFGTRAAQAFLPLLGRTRAELEGIFAAAERHGLIFDQEQLDKAREYGIATRELSESFKGLQVAAGEQLVPFLTDLSIAITKAIDATHGNLGTGFKALLTVIPGGSTVIGVAKGLHLFAAGESEAAKQAAEATAAITEEGTKLDDLQKAIFSATDAQRSFEAAGRSVDSANRSLVKATADYNKLLKEGAVDEGKVADARRSLADASRGLGHAQREQTKAQAEYNDALAAFNILGTDTAADKLADARDNLADANDSVTSATESQTKAAADLKAAQAGDPDFQQKLADAKQGVADATQGVADATYNLGKRSFENVAAHNAEAEAIGSKADQVGRLKDNLEAMLNLHPEQFAFLAPIIAALGTAGPAPGPGGPFVEGGAGGGDFGSSNSPWDALVGAGRVPTVPTSKNPWEAATTNNINVNVTSPQNADPAGLARNIVWNLS